MPTPLEVTEHRAQAVCCPDYGIRTQAAFPAEVAGPVQFGPRLEALAAYLRCAQHLPTARLRALWQERETCLRFLADPAVPVTNNRAERALRMDKLQMKISGGFRTRAGTERFALMRGLVETARQRAWPLLDLLRLGPEAAPP